VRYSSFLATRIIDSARQCFSILQKHIKRQIISLNGGFQVIADLNAYHAFIVDLKVCQQICQSWLTPPTLLQVQSIVMDFSHLKMLGHVFVVEDARDLAQIVRDATRYGGAYRPEVSYQQAWI
jgi:recyclin-1